MTTKDLRLSAWLHKISKFYWSPVHPSNYGLTHQGKLYGLGALAHQDYGLFNLTWSLFPLATAEQHALACAFFSSHLGRLPDVRGQNLSDWLTQLSPQEFAIWHKSAAIDIPSDYNEIIGHAFNVLEEVRIIRR